MCFYSILSAFQLKFVFQGVDFFQNDTFQRISAQAQIAQVTSGKFSLLTPKVSIDKSNSFRFIEKKKIVALN